MAPARRILLWTGLAVTAFAANSILCRLALGAGAIDATSFALLRLASGAVTLVLLVSLRQGFGARGRGGSWTSGLALFLYALPFALAYRQLSAGTGGLLLFSAVQFTMIATALWRGERPTGMQWIGWIAAIAGLLWLLSPGVEAPPAEGSILMLAAGVAWGVYTLRGQTQRDPLAATADNFARATPLALAAALLSAALGAPPHLRTGGVVLAVLSGSVTSGLGYVVWYAALPGLGVTQAATVQVATPALTALGGVLFLGESLALRLVGAALLILGGVTLSLRGGDPPPAQTAASAPTEK